MNVHGHGNIPGNQWNEIKSLKIETEIRKSLSNIKEAVKSHLQGKEMENIPPSTQEKTPSKLNQGKKALSNAWTNGKREINSRVQNLGIGRMLQTESSKILDRLKENHRTAPKEKPPSVHKAVQNVVSLTKNNAAPEELKDAGKKLFEFSTNLDKETLETITQNLSSEQLSHVVVGALQKEKPPLVHEAVQNVVSLAKNNAAPEELKDAGKKLFEFSSSLDKETLATITQNLSSEQLSHVVVGALQKEIEKHVSAGNVLRDNTTGNQLLSQFALSHLSKEFNNSEKLQSLLKTIPKENLAAKDKFNETDIQKAEKFLNSYLDTTQNILSSQSNEMKLFKGIIKETAQNIDNKFGAEVGAGNTAGSNLFFLRVLHPIIITPEARGIPTEKREKDQTQNAILFTKIAQNIANNISYGNKEQRMTAFNELLAAQTDKMNSVKQMLIE